MPGSLSTPAAHWCPPCHKLLHLKAFADTNFTLAFIASTSYPSPQMLQGSTLFGIKAEMKAMWISGEMWRCDPNRLTLVYANCFSMVQFEQEAFFKSSLNYSQAV